MFARRTAFALPAILVGGIFMAVGLLAGVVFGQTSTLQCQRLERSQVDCRLTSDLFGLTLRDVEIRRLQSAYIQTSIDEDGATYRVMIVGERIETPLTHYYSNVGNHQQDAQQINEIVRNPAVDALEIVEKGTVALIIGGIFGFIGFLVFGRGLIGLIIGR